MSPLQINPRQVQQRFGPGTMNQPMGTGRMPFNYTRDGQRGGSGGGSMRGTYKFEDGSTTYGAEAEQPWYKFGGYSTNWS